jgi:hypothetical protein
MRGIPHAAPPTQHRAYSMPGNASALALPHHTTQPNLNINLVPQPQGRALASQRSACWRLQEVGGHPKKTPTVQQEPQQQRPQTPAQPAHQRRGRQSWAGGGRPPGSPPAFGGGTPGSRGRLGPAPAKTQRPGRSHRRACARHWALRHSKLVWEARKLAGQTDLKPWSARGQPTVPLTEGHVGQHANTPALLPEQPANCSSLALAAAATQCSTAAKVPPCFLQPLGTSPKSSDHTAQRSG